MRPRSGTAGLQPAAIAAMRPTLETRVRFELTISGLQPDALPLGYRVWQGWWESNPRSQFWKLVGTYRTHPLDAQEGFEPS